MKVRVEIDAHIVGTVKEIRHVLAQFAALSEAEEIISMSIIHRRIE